MRNSKTIKMALVILLSLILLGVSTSAFATTPPTGTNGTIVITDPTSGTNNTNTTNTAPTPQTTNPLNNTNSTAYGNSTLPQTGSADYVIIGFAVICIISAVYAYKKVKDYNVK